MVEQHDTTTTPRWSTPRLVALGTAQASQGGGITDLIENGFYHPTSV